MRLALCQINTLVGDYEDNAQSMVRAAEIAVAGGATLLVFPELSLTGYPPRDLLDRPRFLHDGKVALVDLAKLLPPSASALVGFVDVEDMGPVRHIYNAAALIEGGRVVQVFHKRLLPNYDVFDERRYFVAGSSPLTFMHRGVRVGVTICEDAWNDVDSPLRQHYQENPVAECLADGAELLVNLSASPFTLRKRTQRQDMFAMVAKRHQRPMAVVNAVGGNDDLIFDGNSSLFGSDGALWARAHRFAEDVLCCDVAASGRIEAHAESDAGAALDALVLGTRDYARKCGFERAVLGLSGGVDSALVAAIASLALGPERVLGLAMPTRYSSAGSLADAKALVSALGMEFQTVDIEPLFAAFSEHLSPTLEALGPAPPNDTTYENIQARIRGVVLMSISNRLGHLLLTTGNKSELSVGYCTLYGDMAGGLAVISDLPKTFVYEVCREVNRRAGRMVIPQTVLEKAPSAELRPDQTDQDSLPPYEVLDAILHQLVEEGQGVDDVVTAGFERSLVTRVAQMVRASEYKRRQMAAATPLRSVTANVLCNLGDGNSVACGF